MRKSEGRGVSASIEDVEESEGGSRRLDRRDGLQVRRKLIRPIAAEDVKTKGTHTAGDCSWKLLRSQLLAETFQFVSANSRELRLSSSTKAAGWHRDD